MFSITNTVVVFLNLYVKVKFSNYECICYLTLSVLIQKKKDGNGLAGADKDIFAEAERLDVKEKAPLILAEILLDEDMLKQLKQYKLHFLRVSIPNQIGAVTGRAKSKLQDLSMAANFSQSVVGLIYVACMGVYAMCGGGYEYVLWIECKSCSSNLVKYIYIYTVTV